MIGTLEGGRVITKQPDEATYKRVYEQICAHTHQMDFTAFRSAYNQIPIVHDEQLRATMDLLRVISESIERALTWSIIKIPDEESENIQILRARKYIDEHLAEKLSLTSVARVACLSEDYFSKLFKRTIGLPFTNYLARTRVQRAQWLLLGTRKQISEIAYECGFESVPNFNRHFKRLTGMAPTLFRQTQQNQKATTSAKHERISG